MSLVHILNDMNSRPLICSFRLNWKNIWLKTVVHLWTCQAELNINFNFNLFLTQSYCVTSEDLEYNTLFCCFVFASVRKVTDLNCGWVNHYIIFCFRWTICLLLLNFYFFMFLLFFRHYCILPKTFSLFTSTETKQLSELALVSFHLQ